MATDIRKGPEILVDDVAIRLKGLNRVRKFDPGTNRIIVDGGARIGDVTRLLAGSGLSLPSLPFLTECSIGAAVADSHSRHEFPMGTVSDFVQSLTVVLPSGEVKTINSTSAPEETRAANVAVGWLGIIVEVELQAVAMPWVRYEELSMTVDDFLVRMPNLAWLAPSTFGDIGVLARIPLFSRAPSRRAPSRKKDF